jgi:hypothetical protein
MSGNTGEFDYNEPKADVFGWMPEYRLHHYQFAHIVMPYRLWSAPEWFLENLYAEHARGFLITRWLEAAMDLDDSQFLTPEDGLDCEYHDISRGYRVAIVSLPEPRYMTEAYMIAVVSRPETRLLGIRIKKPVYRYFTLEYSLEIDRKTEITYLCEWKGTKHINYEIGPEPNLSAFLRGIETILRKS